MEKGLELPNTQILKELWKVVKEDFKFGLSKLGQDDLQKINSGITSIIDGIASIRTHESSAHGEAQNPIFLRLDRQGWLLMPHTL